MTRKYVALDIHAATPSWCVRNKRGAVTAEGVVQTTGSDLVDLIRGLRGEVHLRLEEGPQAEWLYDVMLPYVTELILCNSRANRLLESGNKSDQIDTRKLSEL